MTRRCTLLFLAVVAAQALVPLGIAGLSEAHLAFGQQVRFTAEPVDPLDPFRGQYVALSYPISQLPVPPGVAAGDTVYVDLVESGDEWIANGVSLAPPPDEATFIRGRVVAVTAHQAQIEYGIESYFVEEGEGPRLEQAIARGDLYVDVVLDEDGEAKIAEIVVSE